MIYPKKRIFEVFSTSFRFLLRDFWPTLLAMTQRKKITALESGPYAFALYDATFKCLMADQEIALSFLRAITKRNIVSIQSVSTAIPGLKKKGYTQRHMDFACRCDDGTVFVAEVQLAKHNNWRERSVFYPAGAYVNQLKKGDFWNKLCPVVAINLLGFETGMIQEPGEYDILFQLMDSKRGIVLPLIQILNIELPRVCLEALPDGLLKGWLTLLLKSSELTEIPAYFDETLKKAMRLLEWENWDSEMKNRYFANKFNKDDYSIVIEETRLQSKAEGFVDGMRAIARKMLELGDPLEKVMSLTGLSRQELLARN